MEHLGLNWGTRGVTNSMTQGEGLGWFFFGRRETQFPVNKNHQTPIGVRNFHVIFVIQSGVWCEFVEDTLLQGPSI